MKRIPIYDATVPIACTIGEIEIAGRVELLERLRASHTARRRTEHVLLFDLPQRPCSSNLGVRSVSPGDGATMTMARH